MITLQNLNGSIFDSIVFAEKNPRKWMSGSNGFSRTKPFASAPLENLADQQLIHFAISYSTNGKITGYRNGEIYGKPYSVNLYKYQKNKSVLTFFSSPFSLTCHKDSRDCHGTERALRPAEHSHLPPCRPSAASWTVTVYVRLAARWLAGVAPGGRGPSFSLTTRTAGSPASTAATGTTAVRGRRVARSDRVSGARHPSGNPVECVRCRCRSWVCDNRRTG